MRSHGPHPGGRYLLLLGLFLRAPGHPPCALIYRAPARPPPAVVRPPLDVCRSDPLHGFLTLRVNPFMVSWLVSAPCGKAPSWELARHLGCACFESMTRRSAWSHPAGGVLMVGLSGCVSSRPAGASLGVARNGLLFVFRYGKASMGCTVNL